MFQKVWGIGKILCIIGGITCFRRKFFVSQCRKFRGHPFNVSESLRYRKILCIIGGITSFRRNFLSHSAERFCGHPFNVSKSLGYRKNFMHNRGYHMFPSKIFCLTVPKNFVGIPSMFQKSLGYRKNLCIIEGNTIFRRKLFVSQCRKILWASLQCFRKFGLSKIFMHNRGYFNFSSKTFCLTVPKNFVGVPSMFQKIWGIEKFYA